MHPHSERLSALDAAMLFMETNNTHMHIGEMGILQPGGLAMRRGGLDFKRIRAHVARGLDVVPRYRQRLSFNPLDSHPVWVDDGRFKLDDHLHRMTLPRRGDAHELKRAVGQIMSKKLDLSKPLWEMWIIEGLDEGRFAMVNKLHHCMADGIAAVDILSAFFSPDPTAPSRPRSRWRPRPAPDALRLVLTDLRRRAAAPRTFARMAGAALADPRRAFRAMADATQGVVEAVAGKLRPASWTPLNVAEVGPDRRFDFARFDLDRVKGIKNRLGAKLNDVVLTIVAGGIRRYLEARCVCVDDLDFRVIVPVNTRSPGTFGQLGNQVVPLLAGLPVGIRDPLARLRAVAETTLALKGSKQIHAIGLFEEVCNWADAARIAEVVRRGTRWWAGNLIITNVPGPPVPLYFQDAQLLEGYPVVPMMANQALNIAVLSYAGGLHWGFNADRDAIPDLDELVACFTDEFNELETVSSSRRSRTSRARFRAARRPLASMPVS